MTKGTVEAMIQGAQTDEEIRKKLDDAEFVYADKGGESGSMDLRIPVKGGYIRVCRNAVGEVEVRNLIVLSASRGRRF